MNKRSNTNVVKLHVEENMDADDLGARLSNCIKQCKKKGILNIITVSHEQPITAEFGSNIIKWIQEIRPIDIATYVIDEELVHDIDC